jgi:gliding-associated putative ABC transporter substrate-binding component GldG
MAMNKRTKKATESLAYVGVMAAILVVLNIIGIFVFGRLDVTDKRLFSLSDGSKRLVQGLDEELEITAYFTENLPPPFNATERYVRDLLEEYESAGKGKVKVRFVNPEGDEAREQAETDGVQRVAHQKIENDTAQSVEGYRGIVFKYEGDRRAIAAVGSTEGLEYDITQQLKQLIGEKVKLGILSGHEGPTLEQGLKVFAKFLPNYELVQVDAKQDIDTKIRALLIVAPETPLSEDELRNIDAYVMKGGGLGVFGGTLKIKQDQQELTATQIDTGINTLLEKWGVKMQNEVVADANCGQAHYRTPMGLPIPVKFPPVPIINFDEQQAKHPVAYRLDQVFMPFGATLKPNDALKNDKDVTLTVIGATSKAAWIIEGDKVDLKPRMPRDWVMSKKRGVFPVAIAIEGKLPSAFKAEAVTSAAGGASAGPKGPAQAEKPVHVFVVAASGFIRDEFLPPAEQVSAQDLNGPVAFGLNAVDWLAQEDELIAIRAKSVEEPLIEVPATVREAEDEIKTAAKQGDESSAETAVGKRKEALEDWDGKKARIKLMNVALWPLLLIAFGLVRWQLRKKKRANIVL